MADAIAEVFARTKAEGRAAFVPFVTAGFPTLDATADILLAMEASGADVIEVGMPFSDPLADGGTIQAANTVALRAGVTMEKCLGMVEDARAKGLAAPVILMTYYNPVLRYGEERLVARCKECEPPSPCARGSLSLLRVLAPSLTAALPCISLSQAACTASSWLTCPPRRAACCSSLAARRALP